MLTNRSYKTGHDPKECCICGKTAIYRTPHGKIVMITADTINPKYLEVITGFCADHRTEAYQEMSKFPLDKEPWLTEQGEIYGN